MKNVMKWFLALGIFVLFVACSSDNTANTSSPQTGCGTGSALVGIGDQHFVILCGCQEAAGTIASSGQSLTCTVTAPATIVFQNLGQTFAHQIVSVGSPQFNEFPVMDPSGNPSIKSFGVQITTAGTYSFQDRYNTTLTGQFIVQ